MKLKPLHILLLLFTALGFSASLIAQANCLNYSGDYGICPGGTITYDFNLLPGGGHYSFQYYAVAPNIDVLGYPAPGKITVRANQGNPAFLFCYRYDSVLNCTKNIIQSLWVEHTPNFAGLNTPIPICPDTSLIYAHEFVYQNGPFGPSLSSVQVNGGTLINRHTAYIFSTYHDTLRIKWTAGVPHSITAVWRGEGQWSNGCYIPFTYYPAGQNPYISGPTSGCINPSPMSYSVTNDPGYTYNWTAVNGTVLSGATSNLCSVQWAGSGMLILDRSYAQCSTSTHDTLHFTMYSPPSMPAAQSICPGTQINAGTYSLYSWSNGGSMPAITPTSSGTYSVTVSAPTGCTMSASTQVTLLTLPTPNLGPNQPICPGNSLTLNPGSFASYAWSTGATTPTITVNAAGTYSVTVSNGQCTKADTVVISTAALPNPSLPAAPTLCNGNTLTLNPGNFAAYAWSTGATTQTIPVSTAGTYTVTVTNASGCTNTASSTVSTIPSPTPNLGPNVAICPGSSVTLNPGTFNTYLWNTGATTQSINVNAAGTYSVTVSGPNGCTANASVVESLLPAPSPNLGPNMNLCTGSSVNLNPGNFSSYLWSTGDTTQLINVSAGGTYSVTVTNASGCTANDAITITSIPQPSPNLGPDRTPCIGTTAILIAGSFNVYAWSTGASTSTISVTTSGSYSVTVTGSNGCSASDTINLTFVGANFSLGNDTFICADTSIVLNGPSGMSTYAWSSGASSASTSVSAGGTYMLTVTDANGCVASDTILIQGLTDCVFPGDANYDLVADNQDILSIGAYFGRINAPRANASTQWYGQSTPDWGSPLPLQADPKHSDCDGDGIVDYPDTAVVHLNYGRTHSKAAGITTGGAALRVVALQDSVLPGDIAIFQVMLGDANAQVDSVYGFAFRVNYTQGVTAAPGLTYVDYSNCWFAPASKRISFTEPFPANAAADLAVVRNDQQQRLGFGEICRFGILTDANMSGTSAPLQVWLTQAQQVDAELGPHALEPFADSVVVSDLASGIQAGLNAVQPSIYPNPTADALHILSQGASLQQVEIVDLRGEVLMSLPGEDQSEMVLSTQALSQGMYFVRMRTTSGNSVQKLVIKR